MRRRVIRTSGIAVLLLGIAGAAGLFTVRAQGQEILPALLTEVRGLRAAMEQMASAGPRVQLALGRLQLQEQRINALVRRLEDVRTRLHAADREMTTATDRAKGLEEARDRPVGSDGPSREQLDEMIAVMKREAALRAADMQRLIAEEAAIAADLAAEQGRWTEINQRLEDLERTLGGR